MAGAAIATAGVALGQRSLLARALVAALVALLGIVLFVAAPLALLSAGGGSAPGQIGSGTSIPTGLVAVFNEAARAYQVNAFLLASIAYQESSFGTGPGWRTVNYAGCVGLMQLCVGGAGGDSWDATKYAYRKGQRPASYLFMTSRHPDFLDSFDNVMAAAVELRGKVGGRPLPHLDGVAYRALCGYYGACSDNVAGNYAHDVLARAQTWQRRAAVASPPAVALPIGGGLLSWPVHGPITSYFCERRPWEACHPGIDIAVASGTPIRAAATGRVTTRGWVSGYGNYTCLAHRSPFSTCYAHQSRLGPTPIGGIVPRGGLVGWSGCTGLCFGPHLHFEVRINGQVVDPLHYLPRGG
jgi:murein DD-endopeptidase MepM/ murein hydrolase activator NlpD